MSARPLTPEEEARLRTLVAESKRPPGTRYGAVAGPEDAGVIGDTRVWIGDSDTAEGIRTSCWTFLKFADAQEMAAAREALPNLLASLDEARDWQRKVIMDRDDVVTHMVKRAEETRDAAIARADAAEKRLVRVGEMVEMSLGKIAQRACSTCDGDGVMPEPGTAIGESPCPDCWKRAQRLGVSFMEHIGAGRVK